MYRSLLSVMAKGQKRLRGVVEKTPRTLSKDSAKLFKRHRGVFFTTPRRKKSPFRHCRKASKPCADTLWITMQRADNTAIMRSAQKMHNIHWLSPESACFFAKNVYFHTRCHCFDTTNRVSTNLVPCLSVGAMTLFACQNDDEMAVVAEGVPQIAAEQSPYFVSAAQGRRGALPQLNDKKTRMSTQGGASGSFCGAVCCCALRRKKVPKRQRRQSLRSQ